MQAHQQKRIDEKIRGYLEDNRRKAATYFRTTKLDDSTFVFADFMRVMQRLNDADIYWFDRIIERTDNPANLPTATTINTENGIFSDSLFATIYAAFVVANPSDVSFTDADRDAIDKRI